MMGIARGHGHVDDLDQIRPILDDGFIWLFGGGNLGPVPVLVLWTIVIAGLGHIVSAPHDLWQPCVSRPAAVRPRRAIAESTPAESRCAC